MARIDDLTPYWARVLTVVLAVPTAACLTDTVALDEAGPDAARVVRLRPSADTLPVGATAVFGATVTNAAGGVVSAPTVHWRTSDGAVAAVDTSGLVTGRAPGRALLVARTGAVADTAALVVVATDAVAHRTAHFVAPDGTAGAPGTAAEPWDLATALAATDRVQPGDTVWVRGGAYAGPLTSTVAGAPGAPVLIRVRPGERAVIDGAGTPRSTLTVTGAWVVVWGLEFTNSDPARTTTSTAHDVRPDVIVNDADHTRYVNLIVHDGGTAFYNFPARGHVEVAGSIFYNNGWQAERRADGHGLYLKSLAGPVVARDNVLFNQFGYGIHAYTNAGTGQLVNIRLVGNVAFNNGLLAATQTSSNILVGGNDYATGDELDSNATYFPPGISEINVEVGYGALVNGSVALRDNIFVGGDPTLVLRTWDATDVTRTTLAGDARLLALESPNLVGIRLQGNRHHGDPLGAAWQYLGQRLAWIAWRALTGLGAADSVVATPPVVPRVVLRPSRDDPGRILVVVYNWRRDPQVTIGLGDLLDPGDSYVVHNVQDLFGRPIATGTYEGTISLSLTGLPPPTPVGMTTSPAPTTGPAFDVFLITRP